MRKISVLLWAALLAVPLMGAGIKIDFDAIAEKIPLKLQNGPGYVRGTQADWAKADKQYFICFETGLYRKDWQRFRLRFLPEKSGSVKIFLRGNYVRPQADWILYRNFKITGAELKNLSGTEMDGNFPAYWRPSSNGCGVSKEGILGAHDAYYAQVFNVTAGKMVELSFDAKFESHTATAQHPTAGKRVSAVRASAPAAIKRDMSKAAKIRIEIDARQLQGSRIKPVSFSPGLRFQPCNAQGEDSKFYYEIVGEKPLTDQWQEYEVAFTVDISNGVFIYFRAEDDGSPERWAAYDDVRFEKIDKADTSFEYGALSGWSLTHCNFVTDPKGAASGKNYAVASFKHSISKYTYPFSSDVIKIRFKAKNGGAADTDQAPAVTFDHPRSYYHIYNRHAKYLPLKDKGLKGSQISQVKNKSTKLYPEFVVPADKRTGTDSDKVSIELLEESGVARTASIRFGLPLPEKSLYNFDHIRVVSPDGQPVPAQFAATAWWPDKSVKNVLIQFAAPLKANEKSNWSVEYGSNVQAVSAKSPLKFTDNGSVISVDTGNLQATIDRKHFNLLSSVTVDGKKIGAFAPEGLALYDEQGKAFTSAAAAPGRIAVEEQGVYRVVIRVDGKLTDGKGASLGDYIARIGFTAGSAKVDFALTYFNTNLVNEFTDYTKYETAFVPADKVNFLTMDGVEGKRFFQHNDRKMDIDGKVSTGHKARIAGSGAAGKITFNLLNAWQRYPKAFSVADGRIVFELLPEMPDKDFGSDLPWYCRFPLCQGKYRMKWGMGFTEDLTIDFSGAASPKELGALSVIPVIDRDFLFKTKVYEGTLPKKDKSFAMWDNQMVIGYYNLEKAMEGQREFGFLNFGDNYGERGRNWNNNEYDPANGLFLLFLRTGNRGIARRSFLAARHQADVDIVHAYPNMSFLGCNAQHSIGHTGVSYQVVNPATWSYAYDYAYWGTNGHTWSEGMLDAWLYAGDAVVMDSALLLANHLVDYVSPGFSALGTHERSAGWSVRAMLAYYRATGDKRYFNAAKRVVNIALKEQNFDKGGAWPHKLPADHSGGDHNAYGNCPYLMGILSEMMRQYYRVDPRPEVKKSLISVAGWLRRSHDKSAVGWSYGVSWDCKPYHGAGSGTNGLIGPGLVSGGRLEGNKENFEIGKNMIALSILKGAGGIAKGFAMDVCYNAGMIDEIAAFARENPDVQPFSDDISAFAGKLKVSPDFRTRGGDHKEFEVILKADSAKMILARRRHGSRPQGNPTYDVKVLDAAGKEIFKAVDPTNAAKRYEISLKGKAGDRIRVLIDDDMSGTWSIAPDKAFDAFSAILPDYSIGNSGIAIRYATIPAGVEKFSVTFQSVHEGGTSLYLIDEQGKTIASGFAVNSAGCDFPWMKLGERPERQTVNAAVPKSDKARIVKLLFASSGDVKLQFSGIPPYVSIVPAVYKK